MLKQQSTLFRKIAIMLDIMALSGAFTIAYYLRHTAGAVGELNDYDWLLFFAIPTWFILLSHYKVYDSLRVRSIFQIGLALAKVHAVGGVFLASIIFMFDPHTYSRILFVQFILISFILMSLCKIVVKFVLGTLRRKGFNYRNILIIGTGQSAMRICELISDRQAWGLQIVGLIAVPDGNGSDSNSTANAHFPVIGSVNDVIPICKERVVDDVVIALDKDMHCDLDPIIQELQNLGLTVRIVIDYLAPDSLKTEISLFNNEIPMLTYCNFSLNSNQLLMKRCLDLVGAFVGLLLTALMLPFIALAIKLDSPGPIFFGQPRVRENGRSFICWKFRTMSADAESQKQQLMALNEMNGAMFKIKDDPRVTRIGKFMRKSSLDEFPQFWNVLLGEMSIVGTRPPTPSEVDTYENWHRKRISIKPGITGLWQVSGRNLIQNFDDVVRLDIRYIENWSLSLDLKIILQTLWVVVAGRGS